MKETTKEIFSVFLSLFYRLKEFFFRYGKRWDRLSQSEESAIEYAHTNINPEPVKKISHYVYSWEYCLAHYAGELYNNMLREERTNDDIKSIVDMINDHICKRDLVLYRGVHAEVYLLMKQNSKGIKGVDFYEKAFLNCSLVKGHESKCPMKLRIFVPKGSNVVYLGDVNDEQNYYEVVIQKGAFLKVLSIDKNYINCKLLSTNN